MDFSFSIFLRVTSLEAAHIRYESSDSAEMRCAVQAQCAAVQRSSVHRPVQCTSSSVNPRAFHPVAVRRLYHRSCGLPRGQIYKKAVTCYDTHPLTVPQISQTQHPAYIRGVRSPLSGDCERLKAVGLVAYDVSDNYAHSEDIRACF